jgi:hypothetical protein
VGLRLGKPLGYSIRSSSAAQCDAPANAQNSASDDTIKEISESKRFHDAAKRRSAKMIGYVLLSQIKKGLTVLVVEFKSRRHWNTLWAKRFLEKFLIFSQK